MTGITRRQNDEGKQGIVGDDRNVDEVVERLDAGGSVIVVGALGSGKSHFSRAIVSALRARGSDPVVVRAAAPLSTTPLGALHATGDPRLSLLEKDRAPDDAPFVLVIDDAHALDDDSLAVVARAVYTGRVSALLSVTADPAGALDGGAPEAITDLWLEGGAARYDLHPLDPRSAELLISSFVGEDVLDTATRSVLIVRAGGSRMLLRELVVDAAAQVAADRDPLDPGFELVPGSRLSDAFSSTIAEYTPEQCLALALIGRLRGMAFAHASRSIRPEVIDTLIGRAAIHVDDSPQRHLNANPLLASEAERRLEPGRLDEALDSIARRALAMSEMPSNTPVDRIIAAAWYSSSETIPKPDEVSVSVRGQILSNAARSANARGRADLALAYVRLGLETDGCPPLSIEASRAYTRLHRMPEAFSALTLHPAADISPAVLRRLVRWWATLVTWHPGEHTFEEIEEWLAADGIVDPAIDAEIAEGRAEAACLGMEWERAVELAATVLATPQASSLTRMRAAIVTGTALAELGRFDESTKAFAAAEHANRDAVTGRPRSMTAELAAVAFESIAMMLSGGLRPSLIARLRRASLVAAQRDDRTALTLANIVAGHLHGVIAQDVVRADVELAAALRRFERIEFAAWRPLVAAFRAVALAQRGRIDQATELFHGAEDSVMSEKRLFRFARQASEAEILAAAGEFAAAEETARAAVQQRAAEGRPAEPSLVDRERLDRLARSADAPGMTTGPAPIALPREHLGNEAAAAARIAGLGLAPPRIVGAGHAPAGHGGLGSPGTAGPTSPGLGSPRFGTSGAVPRLPPYDLDDAEPVELTERETEVALLVANHLSNKEIAQRLFLSVRTVESHVYTARGKLGARSRRELGRLVLASPAAGSGSAPVQVQVQDREQGQGQGR